MDKPGGHRTGLNAHFGVDTSVLRNASRNWPGIGGADAAPEPLALRVDNADRGRLLRYVQPNIMRHRNLRWCKPPGNMPGSRHYRCLRLRTAITRGPHHQGGNNAMSTCHLWAARTQAFQIWAEVTGAAALAEFSGRPAQATRIASTTAAQIDGAPGTAHLRRVACP